MEQAVVFERQRRRLFGIAYGIVGNAQDAEDVVGEAALRWLAMDAARVRMPEAWLVTTATRLAIDRSRRATTERRVFTEVWPVEEAAASPRTSGSAGESGPDLVDACRALLERLRPEERVAFVLRDVFDVAYGEVARALDKSEAACRQAVRRARARVREQRARARVAPGASDALVGRCVAAVSAGERDDLVALLADGAAASSVPTWSAR